MGLSRDDILQAADIEYVEIDVPEWGGVVRLASMDGAARETFESVWLKEASKESSQIRATLAALSIVDDDGNRIFTPDDIEALGKKSFVALDRVFEAAQKLNALDDDPEDTEKN